jgi:threonylcarbamoyladenosine tRNA methylthiotransferase MtaB
LNFAETSTLGRIFAEAGYSKVTFGEPADVVVINSCTVTAQADRKCRQAITRAVKTAPGAMVVVVGCFAELKAEEIGKIPGVGLVLGVKEKFNILERIKERKEFSVPSHSHSCDAKKNFFASYSLFDRTRSFLKVQDGCDYHCSYCTIPKARGSSRNAPISEIVRQAEIITGKGIREIVLTGVNIGDFGKSTGEKFSQLLSELDKIDKLERIRIGSVEPNLITGDIIALAAGSRKIAPHFHVPLQSGCNKILGLMGRRYRRELFAEKVGLILRHIPYAAIGADVITGFPGETEGDFRETYYFIESLGLAYLHVFPFSERPDTRAAGLPDKVEHADAENRSKSLLQLSAEKRRIFYEKNAGQEFSVLFERREKGGVMTGFTGNYIKVEMSYDVNCIGNFTSVTLSRIAPSGNMTGICSSASAL